MADEENTESTPAEETPDQAPAGETGEIPAADTEASATPATEQQADQVEPGEPLEEASAAEEAAVEEVTPEAPAAAPAVPDVAAEEPPATEAEETESPAVAPDKRKKKRLPRPLRRQRPKPRRESTGVRKPIVRLPKPDHERGRRQERRGVVVSATTDKTIVVEVDTIKAHPRYKKVVRRSRKFHAHDEENRAKVGDVVRIVETRPISKLKHWRLAEVVEEAR
jgi:small subunit ribosomal protein S17